MNWVPAFSTFSLRTVVLTLLLGTPFVVIQKLQAQSFLTPFAGSSSFQRQLDALQWKYEGGYNWQKNGTTIQLQNRWQTSLFLLDGEAQNIQEENRFDAAFFVPVSPKWRTFFRAQQFHFRAGDVSQWSAAAGADYRFSDGLTFSGGAGLLSDTRNGVRDQGLLLTSAGQSKTWVSGDFSFQPGFRAEYGDLSPRSFAAFKAQAPFHYEVEKFSVDGAVERSFDVRESYQAINFLNRNARDAVESIRTDTTALFMTALLEFGGGITGRAEADGRSINRSYAYRKLAENDERLFFDTGFSARRLETRFTLRKNLSRRYVESGIGYGLFGDRAELSNVSDLPPDQVRRRQEILENSIYSQNRLSIHAQAGSENSARNWRVRAAASILRHNTPDANPDDRDEQQLALSAETRLPISEEVSLFSSLSGERMRNAYLFARRSAENNDRYSLRLNSTMQWIPSSKLVFSQQLFLRSNYTVYQFPEAIPGIADQSAREYGFRTDASWRFLPRKSISVSVQRNELRIGRLYWSDFAETPLDTLITIDASATLSHYFHSGWISLGFRFFSKWDFMPLASNSILLPDGATTTQRSSGRFITRQFGPTIDLRFPFESKHELFLRGWYQLQQTRQLLYTTYPEPLREQFLANESNFPERVFPNVELMARLKF